MSDSWSSSIINFYCLYIKLPIWQKCISLEVEFLFNLKKHVNCHSMWNKWKQWFKFVTITYAFFFFQTQDFVVEGFTAESASVRPRNKEFKPQNYSHFEVFADRLDSQTSTGRILTKCTFQPGEKCVIKGLLPFITYSIRLRACDQSSSCSGFRVGKGFWTLSVGKFFIDTILVKINVWHTANNTLDLCVKGWIILINGTSWGGLKFLDCTRQT